MRDFKIHVHSPEESAIVQELMFKLRYAWGYNTKEIRYPNEPYLFLDNNRISYCDDGDYFENHSFRELTLNQLLDEIENIINK